MTQTGRAGVTINIVDLSVLVNTGLKGLHAVHGPTLLGESGKSKVINNWADFLKNYGGLSADTDFPLYCKRALEGGARLRVARANHYTTPSDATTIVGTKATKTIQTTVDATVASIVTGSNGHFVISSFTDLTAYFPVGRTFIISGANSGNGSYTVTGFTYVSGTNTITVATISGGMTTPATLTYVTEEVVLRAEAIGADYNNISTTFSVNTLDATKRDVVIQHSVYPNITATRAAFPSVPTVGDIADWNLTVQYVKIVSYFLAIPSAASGFLAGGAETISTVNNADLEGAGGTNPTGIHIFDDETDFTRISVPALADTAFDIILCDYAELRGDCRAIVRTPTGLDGTTAVDYREGTGIYNQIPIDSWYGSMVYGALVINDPLTQLPKNISAIGDVMGLMASTDNQKGEWFSYSGSKRGRIRNATGIVYNLGSPAKKAEADLVDAHGLNMVINHPSFGLVSWGNGTLYKQPTLLKHENIAALTIFMIRSLGGLIQTELFDPNDPLTWQAIYRRVKPFLDFLSENRAFYGAENTGWIWQGDQTIDNVVDAKVTTQADIALGKFTPKLLFKPTVALKYVGLQLGVTNAGVDFSVFQDVQI